MRFSVIKWAFIRHNSVGSLIKTALDVLTSYWSWCCTTGPAVIFQFNIFRWNIFCVNLECLIYSKNLVCDRRRKSKNCFLINSTVLISFSKYVVQTENLNHCLASIRCCLMIFLAFLYIVRSLLQHWLDSNAKLQGESFDIVCSS